MILVVCHGHGGSPTKIWLVYFMENPKRKYGMMTRRVARHDETDTSILIEVMVIYLYREY